MMIRALLVAVALAVNAHPAFAAELLMFRTSGCPWCIEFDRVLGPIYPKTELGQRFPLRFEPIGAQSTVHVALARPVRYTPTFVVVSEGREVGRIEGYPGEELFWWRLQKLVDLVPEQ